MGARGARRHRLAVAVGRPPDRAERLQPRPGARRQLERELDRGARQRRGLYVGNADASDGAEYLAPVGSYRWSDGPYGTRDQAGNAAEWTADAYLPPVSSTGATLNSPLGYDDLGVVDPVS